MRLTEDQIDEIEELAGKHSVLYWPEILELIARARELAEVRRILAGTDAASLPDDMSVLEMAQCRMNDWRGK
jgi:hypothetical protein